MIARARSAEAFALLSVTLLWVALHVGCANVSAPGRPALDREAEEYARLVVALGERDPDSLDDFYGPSSWRADAQSRQTSLTDIRHSAEALRDRLSNTRFTERAQERRREFLTRQLGALMARIDLLDGARWPFAEESRRLFDIDIPPANVKGMEAVRASIDRLLPGPGELRARYAAFDRRFLIPPGRVPAVLARAFDECRRVTREHVELPADERVDLTYVHDSPWSAFTRYLGGYRSRIDVNVDFALTPDRALQLACHEGYPGHHVMGVLVEDGLVRRGRVELTAQPLFSPRALLAEGTASFAPELAFPEAARVQVERDALFPLAGLDAGEAERYVRVAVLVDRLHAVELDVARRYLDGELEFARAAAVLEHDALMPSADATLKFLNEYRSFAVTYTRGRDMAAAAVETRSDSSADAAARWRAYLDLIASPDQAFPPPPQK